MTTQLQTPTDSLLGKKTTYDSTYNKDLLFPILRAQKRMDIGINDSLPFVGFDVWNHYEVSWLNEKGKPIAALAEIIFPCDSPYLLESKSVKLYFNSLNNTPYTNLAEITQVIQQDLSHAAQASVLVKIIPVNLFPEQIITPFLEGYCLDDLDIECSQYTVAPQLLKTEKNEAAQEMLYSHLLRSNCLVTGQPDWGTIQIQYEGRKINHASLLQYLVSFRNHTEFGEHCIERIFMDITTHCQPAALTITGRFTRRGGLDINPVRSTTHEGLGAITTRLCRQ